MSFGKLLIIDDSLLVRNYLAKAVSEIPNLQLVDSLPNGEKGFQKILEKSPDVVILDLEMANGDGLYVLQQIKKHIPFGERPFVLIYSSRAHQGDTLFKEAINFGFCDFILKVEGRADEIISNLKKAFIPKIIAGIEAKRSREQLFRTKNASDHLTPENSSTSKSLPVSKEPEATLIPEGLQHLPMILRQKKINPKLIILGASTGGPQVIRSILKYFNPSLSIPIAIIQHMPQTFTKSFAQELHQSSDIPVHELKHNMSLQGGHAYVFPGGMHGKLNSFGNLFVYYADRKEYDSHPFKPSVNLAIEHLMQTFQGQVVGAILSGMGSDGAIGMKKLKDTGSLVFAQDKQSSSVWGMPGSTVRQNGADIILSHDELGQGIIQSLVNYRVHSK